MAQETVTLHIPAIHCDGCLDTVRSTIERVGAAFDSGHAGTKHVTVSFDGERLTRGELEAALEEIGFPPQDQP